MNPSFGPCPRGEKTCLHDLAAGRTTVADACPACTARFMAGMDWAAGQPLDWHPKYLARTTP
jgi:hypothetical protein